MMPFFIGHRFGGWGSELNLKEFKDQIKYLIGIQGLGELQQLP